MTSAGADKEVDAVPLAQLAVRLPTARASVNPVSGDTTPCKVTPVFLRGVVASHSGDPNRACIPRPSIPPTMRLAQLSHAVALAQLAVRLPTARTSVDPIDNPTLTPQPSTPGGASSTGEKTFFFFFYRSTSLKRNCTSPRTTAGP